MHVHLNQMFNQMTEYRARTTAIESHRGLVGPPSSFALEEPPAFMSLAKQYGLTDEDFDASEPDDHGVGKMLVAVCEICSSLKGSAIHNQPSIPCLMRGNLSIPKYTINP